MALYHKRGFKTGFTFALQFFMLIFDGLDGVPKFIGLDVILSVWPGIYSNSYCFKGQKYTDPLSLCPNEGPSLYLPPTPPGPPSTTGPSNSRAP